MELNQKELKRHIKCLVRDIKEWNPGKELPDETTVYLKKKDVTIDDFWDLRKVFALAGLHVSPPYFLHLMQKDTSI